MIWVRCIVSAFILLTLPAAFGGCAPKDAPSAYVPQAAAGAPVWPPAPEKPRYAYVTSLIGEKNMISPDEKRFSGLKAAFRWFAGIVAGEGDYLELQRPVSGTTDAAGRIYVVDASHRAVMVFDTVKRRLLMWRAAAKGLRFKSPVAIAGDGAGGFLITDSELAEVFRLNAEGRPIGRFGKRILTRPTGIAHDPQTGNTYVADTARHDIKIFNRDGVLIDTLGGKGIGPGRFNTPTHLAFFGHELYVSDTLNFRVQVFDRAGDGRLVFGRLGLFVGNMTRPKGVAVAADGRIYVVESLYDHLLVFNQAGKLLLPLGGTGRGPGQFFLPSGVWTDARGRVYIADMFNGRVIILQELGPVGES